jgi:3-methyladenine DNA glycosylase/8-oxoguanine DNA glycosylase
MRSSSPPDSTRRLRLSPGSRPELTLAPLWHGPRDLQLQLAGGLIRRASRTSAGPASVELRLRGVGVEAAAWGPGAATALDALPALLGDLDDPSLLRPRHPLVAELARRLRGLRLARTGHVFSTLAATIIAQKVTGTEAGRSLTALVRRFGEPAPGPLGLWLAPTPASIAGRPYHEFHPLGLERRRAESLRAAAAAADRLEQVTKERPELLRDRLLALPGVGGWTAAETVRLVLGDPDAVSVGDYNLPSLVSWALAGEPRGDDARMLELLEPYHGQRARVVLLLEMSGLRPPRRGPRLAPREIASI